MDDITNLLNEAKFNVSCMPLDHADAALALNKLIDAIELLNNKITSNRSNESNWENEISPYSK